MPVSRTVARRVGSTRGFDADAAAYIRAVQSADGAAIEPAVAFAINNFVLGCKADGIWSAIKACCLLMGARTLSGALTPLVGAAPTNNNFVSGDYNRKTGLVANGTTKNLSANRLESDDGLNDNHYSAYVSTVGTQGVIGGTYSSTASTSMSNAATRNRNTSADSFTLSAGFFGISRASSAAYSRRNAGATSTMSTASVSALGSGMLVFDTSGAFKGNHRIAFYSMGSSLTLSLLDSRASTLYTAIGIAIA